MMKEAVDDLSATLAEAASASGAVGGMVDSITQAINKVRNANITRSSSNEYVLQKAEFLA